MLITCFALFACAPKTVEDYVSDANKFISNNKYQEASIILKKGVSEFPESAKLREQLADSLSKVGDIAGATQAYNVSLEIEYRDQVAIRLFELLRLQERNETIIEIYEQTASKHEKEIASLSLYYAIALAKENEPRKSNMLLRKIDATAQANSFEKTIASAYLNWYNGNPKVALKFFTNAQQQKADSYDAALGAATVALSTQNYQLAATAIETLLDKQEAGNISRILLAHSYLNMGLLDKAETQISILESRIPESLPYLVLSSTHYILSNDFERAKIDSEKAILLDGKNAIARKIAVVANYKLGNYEQAYNFLKPIISGEKQISNSILNMAIELKSQMGLFDEEFDGHLSDLTALDSEMYESYANTALNALSRGSESVSRKMSKMLRDIELKDINAQTARKLTVLHSNFDSQLALTLSGAIYEKSSTLENLAMYATLLARNNELEKSLEFVNDAKNKHSTEALLELKFQLFVIAGDAKNLHETARTLYEKDSSNAMANAYYFNQAASDGRLADAISFCNELEKNQSTPIGVLYQCFSFLHTEKAKESDRLALKIEQIFEGTKSSSKNLHFYVQTLVDKKELRKLTSILTSEILKELNEVKLWQVKIDALSFLNEPEEIALTFRQWRNANPNSKHALLKQITYLETIGELNNALRTLNDFENKFGTSDLTKVLRVHFLLSNNKIKQASLAFDTLPYYMEGTPPWLGLQGRIHLANGRYDLALSSLLEAYSTNPTSRNTGAIIAAYLAKKDFQVLESFLISHVKNKPNDSKARNVLTGYYLQSSSEKALPLLAKSIEENPYDLDSLNNYAWLLNASGQTTKAISFSELLLKLSEKPSHLHTVAIVYESSGLIEKSMIVFERMMELAPPIELKREYQEFLERNELSK